MAMSPKTFKSWYLVHKWTSLLTMVFLLMLCITGLPLIFHQEIDEFTRAPDLSAEHTNHSDISLNALIKTAKAEKPNWSLMFLVWDEDKPIISAILGPTMQSGEGEVHFVMFDKRTGERLSALPPNEGVMYFLLDLHGSLLLGLPGTLFLGFIGIVFIISVVSGVVVYVPFMRHLQFATVRKKLSNRIKWLDVHNMVGIVTVAWVSVVGITGIILTLVTPLTSLWQQEQLSSFIAPQQSIQNNTQSTTLDNVRDSVFKQVHNADIAFVSMPGSPYATPQHYTVALRGDTPLTERLIRVAIVEASTGTVTAIKDTPWYLTMVNLSVPLHFGDYGGLPLKIIWALLNIAAIIVLITGLYLWLKHRNKLIDKQLTEINS